MSNEPTNTPIATHTLNRREVLKALAAAGGATALTAMSGQWVKPLVEVGALPAHAQGSAPTPAPTLTPAPIVRTANVGTVPGLGAFYYSFVEGPITDAQITACAPTTITFAWTGVPVSGLFGEFQLTQALSGPRANTAAAYSPGATSPQTHTDPDLWTGGRPYNGLLAMSDIIDWNVGVLTITLS